MQGSSIQNVFDNMFKRFRSRPDTTAICDEKKKEICNVDQNAHTESPEQNDSTEVIEVCDSEDDCSKYNDDVVFLGQTTNSESAESGDNQSKW